MQIETTMRYHLIPVRMAIIKKTSFGEDVAKRESSYTVGWNEIGVATMETIWRFLKKLRIELPYDPTIIPLGTYPKNSKIKS